MQLNFQQNTCLYTTTFTPTVMQESHTCTLTTATELQLATRGKNIG